MKRKIIISALALILLACLLPGAMLAADNGDGSGAGEANASGHFGSRRRQRARVL